MNYKEQNILLFLILFSIQIYAQPTVLWGNEIGGFGTETPSTVLNNKTTYTIVGTTNSWNDGEVEGSIGIKDFWIYGIDSIGNIVWQNVLGGTYNDIAHGACKANDTNYILVGTTYSNDIDVTGLHGIVNNKSDGWIVKTNSKGKIIWQRTLGGSDNDELYHVQQTTDGGYIVIGSSQSSDGDIYDISNYHKIINTWVIKLDAEGAIEWSKLYGGNSVDYGYTIKETTDGGFIFAGDSYSNNGDLTANHGNRDVWVCKLSSLGAIEWSTLYGGTGIEEGKDIIENTRGEFIIIGSTTSLNGDVTATKGGHDIWLIKLDQYGTIITDWSFGGSYQDFGSTIIEVRTGGYIIGGKSNSNDEDMSGLHGVAGSYYNDSWIAKISEQGTIIWATLYGGSLEENVQACVEGVKEGTYCIANVTNSTDGDIDQYNNPEHGGEDMWIIEIDEHLPLNSIEEQNEKQMKLFPNPFHRYFSVASGESHFNQNIKIYNLLGELEMEVESAKNVQIDGFSLSKGVHILKIDGFKNQKIVKE